MAESPMTLSEHLARQQAALSAGSGASAPNVATVVGRIGRVAAVIAQELAHAALRDQRGYAGGSNVTGDQVKKLDVWGHEVMVAALRETRACAAVISEEAPEPIEMGEAGGANALVVCTDPVDGSSHLDVNGSGGTILALPASPREKPPGPAARCPRTTQLRCRALLF